MLVGMIPSFIQCVAILAQNPQYKVSSVSKGTGIMLIFTRNPNTRIAPTPKKYRVPAFNNAPKLPTRKYHVSQNEKQVLFFIKLSFVVRNGKYIVLYKNYPSVTGTSPIQKLIGRAFVIDHRNNRNSLKLSAQQMKNRDIPTRYSKKKQLTIN